MNNYLKYILPINQVNKIYFYIIFLCVEKYYYKIDFMIDDWLGIDAKQL